MHFSSCILYPVVIMLDFEVSTMNAFRTVLPTASIHCLYYHLHNRSFVQSLDATESTVAR